MNRDEAKDRFLKALEARNTDPWMKTVDDFRHEHPLKAKLRAVGLSQVLLANALKMHPSTLSAYLNGHKTLDTKLEATLDNLIERWVISRMEVLK